MTNYNIHPIFVHFPVALLMIYSLLEFTRFKKITEQPYWFYVKATFVIIGALASYLALFTGSIAEDIVAKGAHNNLVEMHSDFAVATAIIFSVIAGGYFVSWANKAGIRIWNWLLQLANLIIETKLVILLAFLGAVFLFITGTLGGSIVYGHQNDPVTNFIYGLFFR